MNRLPHDPGRCGPDPAIPGRVPGTQMTPIGTWIQTLIGTQLQTNRQHSFALLNVSGCIHSVSQWGHGARPSWGSGSGGPTGTQSPGRGDHRTKNGTRLLTVEGHVPKGVGVRPSPSALPTGTQDSKIASHVPRGSPFRHMVFSMYRLRDRSRGKWFFFCQPCTERSPV